MMLRSASLGLAISLWGAAAAAQRIDVTLPQRSPSSGGSFVATFGGATLGAAAGLAIGAVLAPMGPGACDLSVGGGCGSAPNTGTMAFVAGTTMLGAAGGAFIGRRATGGNQSVIPSALGAATGLLTGAWLSSQLRLEEPAPIVIALTIPTGLFATLAGW